jgi:hypothetical protein
MTKRAFDKIKAGLEEALSGRWARATLFENGRPVQRYTPCDCGNVTLTVGGRCELCGARKFVSITRPQEKPE